MNVVESSGNEALDYLWVIIYFESSYSHPLSVYSQPNYPSLAPLCLLWARLNVTPAIRHLQLPSAVIRSVILTRRKFLSASALARSHIPASLEQTHLSESLESLSRLWHWMPTLSLVMTPPGDATLSSVLHCGVRPMVSLWLSSSQSHKCNNDEANVWLIVSEFHYTLVTVAREICDNTKYVSHCHRFTWSRCPWVMCGEIHLKVS